MSHKCLGYELGGKNGTFNGTVMMQSAFGLSQTEHTGCKQPPGGPPALAGPASRGEHRPELLRCGRSQDPQHTTQTTPWDQQSCRVIWCEGEPGCAHQRCCSLATFISTPWAGAGAHSTQKNSLPRGEASSRHLGRLLEHQRVRVSPAHRGDPGLSPRHRGGDAGTGLAAVGGHPPSPPATGARSDRDWGLWGEQGSPAGGSRLGLSLHLVGTRRDVASDAPDPAIPPCPGSCSLSPHHEPK